MPFPESSGMEGYWEVDRAMSSPFPTPVHKMLKISAIGQRLQSLCPGVLVSAHSRGAVKHTFAPALAALLPLQDIKHAA